LFERFVKSEEIPWKTAEFGHLGAHGRQ
jgi:hypothetical protein